RACRWQKLLEDGVYASLAEIAEKERINRSYLSRTIRLSLLAPEIVEAILNGSQPSTLRLADLEAPFPVDWQQQRAGFGFPAKHAGPLGLAGFPGGPKSARGHEQAASAASLRCRNVLQ